MKKIQISTTDYSEAFGYDDARYAVEYMFDWMDSDDRYPSGSSAAYREAFRAALGNGVVVKDGLSDIDELKEVLSGAAGAALEVLAKHIGASEFAGHGHYICSAASQAGLHIAFEVIDDDGEDEE